MYDLAGLEAALAGTVFAGKLHYSPSTGSTNSDALEAARHGAPAWSVYFADEQREGRGRADHQWHSAAGDGLYVSVLLRLPITALRLPLLPLAVGLAAAEAIRAAIGLGTGSGPNSGPDAGPKIDLRWPNDLLIGAGKVGGILVETKTSGGEVNFAVAGIGINVHQRSFAPDLATPATSLDLETGVPSDRSSSLGWKTGARISRQALLAALLKSLEREARGLLDPEAAALIPQRVERASTWMRGQRIEVHGPQACVGVTAGLDEHGFLLVRTGDGVVTVQTGGIRSVETDFGKTD